ncbi:STAS domain-containing protein [Streptomyces sp. NPDC058274]|uniref:STAS domain-containing protein n=1 Tax=Streptomyces sp. NPDC058274 TaxID=3346416 RepID=UPI0036E05DED
MSLSVREAGRSTVIAVRGEVDLGNAGQLAEAIAQAALARPDAVVLELAEVRFADSTTVNVILQAYASHGARFRLAALSPFVERVLEITGVLDVLPVYATAAEALEADPGPGRSGQTPGTDSH